MILQHDSNLAGVVFSQEAVWPDVFFVSLTEYPKLSQLSLKSFGDVNPVFKILNPFSNSSREFKNVDFFENPNPEDTIRNSSFMHFSASWLF